MLKIIKCPDCGHMHIEGTLMTVQVAGYRFQI